MEPRTRLICVLFISGQKFATNFHFIRSSSHLEMFNSTRSHWKWASRVMHRFLNLSNRKFRKRLHRLKSCTLKSKLLVRISFHFHSLSLCLSVEFSEIDDRSISVRIFDDNGFDIGEEISCMLKKNTGTGR